MGPPRSQSTTGNRLVLSGLFAPTALHPDASRRLAKDNFLAGVPGRSSEFTDRGRFGSAAVDWIGSDWIGRLYRDLSCPLILSVEIKMTPFDQ